MQGGPCDDDTDTVEPERKRRSAVSSLTSLQLDLVRGYGYTALMLDNVPFIARRNSPRGSRVGRINEDFVVSLITRRTTCRILRDGLLEPPAFRNTGVSHSQGVNPL